MTTDRAKRYAANRTIQDDKRAGCLYCGSHRNLGVDHISGDEADIDTRNLAWACKSCNTRKGAAFAKAGIGRKTHQYNPHLGLSPAEKRNFQQLGFDFPPRSEYDQARAADRKRRQQARAAAIRERREERKAEARRRKQERAEEQRRLKAQMSELGAQLQRARRSGDKGEVRSLTDEINELAGQIRRNPATITTPAQWSEAVRAVLGQPSTMGISSAASRIRATPPGQRRKLARGMRPNPGKSPTYQQYAFAVSGYDHGRGDVSLGEIIHRTPPAKRAEYARLIAAAKRQHGTEHLTGTYRTSVPF